MSETNTDTIVRIAGLVVVLGLVAPFVVTGAPAVVGAEESYVVLSGSMAAEPEPVIKPGDVVIVNSVDADALGEGDIITFDRGGDTPTTHRIVAVEQQDGQRQFVTKGDNNEDADPQPVGPDQVIGRVMFTLPLVGHVVQFANTTLGFATLVGVPIGLLVLSEAWTLARNPERSPFVDGDLGGDDDPDAGDGPTVGSTAAVDPSAEEANETVTLGETHLRNAVLVLAPAVAATGVASYRLQTAWALTLFYASLVLFVLSGALYLRMTGALDMGDGDAAAGDATDASVDAGATPVADAGLVETATDAAPIVVTGRVQEEFDGEARVLVDVTDREELLALARRQARPVVEHPTTGVCHLVGGDTVFRYDPDGGSDPATNASTETPNAQTTPKRGTEHGTVGTATDGGSGGSGSDGEWTATTEGAVVDPGTNTEGAATSDGERDEWIAAVERVVTDESTDANADSNSSEGR